MAINDDVLVVGGGLAGAIAALAARDAGASVRVISKSESTLQQASGLIDVLGYPDPHGTAGDGDGGEEAGSEPTPPVSNPVDAIEALPASHPYRIVGVDALRAGLGVFDAAVGDLYRGEHTDRNALVPTVGGSVKPTARYPTSVADGLASDDRSMAIVGFAGDPSVDAGHVAARLEAAGVPFDVVGATVDVPGDLDGSDQRTRLAHALDADDDGIREELAGRTRRAIDTACRSGDTGRGAVAAVDRVGFPAVLGRDRPRSVRETLAAALDADVFELPPAPPSLPGLRLRYRLRAALRDAGVAVTTGVPVVDYDATAPTDTDSSPGDRPGERGRAIRTVYADRNGTTVPYVPDAVVLATGGLVGEGIQSDRTTVEEPVFDCPIAHPEDRAEWSAPDAFGEHAFATFGVAIDDAGRVRDDAGELAYRNLTAAGGVVGNAHVAAEKSASGVSIATGYAAGTTAAAIAAGETPRPATQTESPDR